MQSSFPQKFLERLPLPSIYAQDKPALDIALAFKHCIFDDEEGTNDYVDSYHANCSIAKLEVRLYADHTVYQEEIYGDQGRRFSYHLQTKLLS